MTAAREGLYYADGINARTGGYLLEPLTADGLIALARSVDRDASPTEEAVAVLKGRAGRQAQNFPLAEGIERSDLAETGWGIILPAARSGSTEEKRQAAILEALQPLIALRKK